MNTKEVFKQSLKKETNKYIKGLNIQITMFGVIDGLWVSGTDK